MTQALISPDDQRVTFVELFFDLVFVFCVTQVVTLLHGHVTPGTAGGALLVLWLVWWAWTQFTWALNAANTDHPRVQFATLIATAIAFFLAVGIPRALTDASLWFAVPYVLLRVVGLVIYHWVAGADPEQRRAVRVFGLLSVGGLIAVVTGALFGGAMLYGAWALAIVLDLVAAGVGGRREGWNLHPDHFIERHGLIVIIALGETLIVAASGLSGATLSSEAIATAVLALAVTCGLWWCYFLGARPAFEHGMSRASGRILSELARDAFSVLHFPMLCGVIAVAAATEEALSRPDEPLSTGARVALGTGTTLFVVGAAAAIWRATGHLPFWRLVLPPVAAVVVILLNGDPWLPFALTASMLVVLSVLEYRRPEAEAG